MDPTASPPATATTPLAWAVMIWALATIIVGNGNDSITAGGNLDGTYRITAGDGNDTIVGSGNLLGSYSIAAGNGNDTITGWT